MSMLDFRSVIYDLKSKIENQKSKIASVLCLAFCVLYFGCGSDSEEEQIATPGEYVQRGWEEYGSGNYGVAMQAFEKAISGDGDHLADAYNGLGWVYLGFSRNAAVDQKNLATALDKFQEAISCDSSNADAWVGKAALLLVRRDSQNDFRDALKAIDNALQGNAEYLYRHDYNSEADLYALKAQCYYYLGELDEAQNEVGRALDMEKHNSVALAMKKLL